MRTNLMCFGFDHGNGWFDLEWRLCEDLEKLGVGPGYKLFQVKEKFGTLRWYATDDGSAVDYDVYHARVREAERESAKTCEACGQPGKLRDGGWVHTYCDACEAKRSKPVEEEA